MFRRLILLFILVPIVELALLIQLGSWIGLWPTLGLIVLTGVLGAALASREGLRAWHALQMDVSEGRIPGRPILDGLSVFAGGALLLTPGLMTDLLGFTLLWRPTRHWLQNRAVKRLGGALVERGQIHVRASADWRERSAGPETARSERPAGRELEHPDRSQ